MVDDASKFVQVVRGFKLPLHPFFVKEKVEQAMDYMPRDGDIIAFSYPKTGTHWLSYIVMQIVSQGELFPAINVGSSETMPYMETVDRENLDNAVPPRKFSSNLAYNFVPKNPNSKVLYIYRHPEDVFVSYFHFLQGVFDRDFDMEEFFDDFLNGYIGYGLYFEHILSFLEHESDDNLLFVCYEEVSRDPKGQILRMAEFLGEEYHRPLFENDSVMDKVLEHISFAYMKKNLDFSVHGQEEMPKRLDFFRKGVVGDGKDTLSLEQRERLKKKAKEYLDGTKIFKQWYEGK